MTRYTPRTLPDRRAMLNIGCGNRYHAEWTNIDHIAVAAEVIAHDITSGLPFADNSFDVVYHSHVLEHLQPEVAKTLLKECYRVLKPNGMLRVLVPDLEFSTTLYLQALHTVTAKPSPVHHEHYEWALLNLIDQMVRIRSGGKMTEFILRDNLQDIDFIVTNGGGNTIREMRNPPVRTKPAVNPPFYRKVSAWIQYRLLRRGNLSSEARFIRFRQSGENHQWMYDRYSLQQVLAACGFSDLQHLNVHESQIADWSAFHLDIDADGHIHKPCSLVYEGRK
jgi:predicted SAM-dependent methyltransferase